MEEIYELLGISEDSTAEEIETAYVEYRDDLKKSYDNGEISDAAFIQEFSKLQSAYTTAKEDRIRRDEEAARLAAEQDEDEEEFEPVEREAKKGHPVRNLLIGVGIGAILAGSIALSTHIGWKLGRKSALEQCANEQSRITYLMPNETEEVLAETTTEAPTEATTEALPEETVVIEETTEAPQVTPAPTEATTEAPTEATTEVVTEAATEAPAEEIATPVFYGDVMDDALVADRANELIQQLNAAGIVNPETAVPYTFDQIFALIKYANGVYVPSSTEEIDVLHLNLLNLLISPLNTDAYLYHCVFANGNDDFNDLLVENPVSVGFAKAFAEYGENGVYPLIQWIQQKRFDIFASLDRNEVNRIYDEVGQVMADLMKGNGCTITWEGVEYHFTSEQVLANHSSAMILTTEAQLVFANHYEIRNEFDEIVEQGKTSWDVYNKFNSNGVDENGQPIIEPDHVSLEEIEAWINNGCDYEWAIESVLIDGQTFGQRIQGDMEGMALNNLAVGNVSLTK